MSNYNRLEAEYQKVHPPVAGLEGPRRQSSRRRQRGSRQESAGEEGRVGPAGLNRCRQSVDQARAASETLKQQVGELKRKIDEGERTATTLVARKNAATAQRKVAEALSGAGSANNAFAALGTFEESVAREEATAKAFNQIAATGGEDHELESEFAKLEGHSVDDDLEALKRERALPPPSTPKAISAPVSTVSTGAQ